MKKYHYTIILFLFSFVYLSVAQEPDFRFEHITVDDGLSQNSVFCILQDRKGFLWFGTQDGGLNKFDGYDFTIYIKRWSDPGSIVGNNISTVFEDRKGLIWIGTWGAGLDLYDPSIETFTHFQYSPDNPDGISHNRIQAIIEDQHGYIWIGTAGGGLNKFDPNSKLFVQYKADQPIRNSLSHDHIWDLVFDSNGLLWIATEKGISFFDTSNEQFLSTESILGDDHGSTDQQIRCLLSGSDGSMWIGTSNGVYQFDIKRKEILPLPFVSNTIVNPESNAINRLYEDRDGRVWIGTHAYGLLYFNKENERFFRFEHDPKIPSSLSFNDIRDIFQDTSGNLWIATRGGGVNKLDLNAKKFSHHQHNPFDPESLSSNQVWAICQDHSGRIWIGTYGGGLNLFNKERSCLTHFLHHTDQLNSLSNNNILSLFPANNGTLWIGTQGGGLNKMNPETGEFIIYASDSLNQTGIGNNIVSCLLEEQDGILWIGTDRGLDRMDVRREIFSHYRHNPQDTNTLSDNRVWVIFKDRDEHLWIGTDNGLNLFYPEEGIFQRFLHQPDNKSSISDNDIFCIHQDQSGHLWFGTGRGFNRLDDSSLGFVQFHSIPLLSENPVYGILEDNENNLWISTLNGLIQFNIHNSTIRHFDVSDGLQSDEFIRGAYWKNQTTGELFFGGINGFNAFFPEQIKDNEFVPPIVITQFNLFNQPVEISEQGPLFKSITETKTIHLNYRQYDFSLRFVSLNYTNSHKNQYKYRLEGYDSNWKEVSSERTATFTNISPGTYRFQVIGSNNDDVWNNEGASILITMTPPFWKTKAFYILCFILVLVSVVITVKVRERKLRQEKRVLEAKVTERTREVLRQKSEIEKKNIEITDSITYAQRIQHAILPEQKDIARAFPEFFILFQPKDIVSGDFYWFGKHSGKQIIAVIDCTGHGVPGAFMSMIGNSLLNQIVFEKNITDPSEILYHLDQGIIQALKQDSAGFNHQDDGMDAAICSIIEHKHELLYAGASLPVLLIQNGSCRKIEGDIYSLGGVFSMDQDGQFTLHRVPINPGEIIYIYSDGFQDQFGGLHNKKYMASNFEKLLHEISKKQLIDQKKILETVLNDWRGDRKQTDDILIVGIKLGP